MKGWLLLSPWAVVTTGPLGAAAISTGLEGVTNWGLGTAGVVAGGSAVGAGGCSDGRTAMGAEGVVVVCLWRSAGCGVCCPGRCLTSDLLGAGVHVFA